MFKDRGSIRRAVAILVAAVLGPAVAGAQPGPGAPDPHTVHIRLGPLWVKPTLAITNLGVDTNLFNESDANHPQSDVNLTLVPAVNMWLPFRSSWINGSVKEDLVSYKKFASEQSASTSSTLGWTIPLARITMVTTGSWLKTKERPGFEIDARAVRSELTYGGAVELRALSKTHVGVRAERREVAFDEGQTFLGSDLHDELNRTKTVEAVTLRHELTPLTSLTLDGSRIQDRFEFSRLRDADSTQITAGVAFTPDALVSGFAKMGYLNFSPLEAALPEFRGATAAANLSYVARDSTRLKLQVTRDVQFSFDINQPYYLLTGATASVSQQIYGPIDVDARLTRERLSYRERAGQSVEVPNRVDRARSVGVGIGYRVGENVRVAFNIDQQTRESAVESRSYSGLRYGIAVTYGL